MKTVVLFKWALKPCGFTSSFTPSSLFAYQLEMLPLYENTAWHYFTILKLTFKIFHPKVTYSFYKMEKSRLL